MLIVGQVKRKFIHQNQKHMTTKMYHLYYRENREAITV